MPTPREGGHPAPGGTSGIRRLRLPNGLRVLIAPDPFARRAAVCVHYHVGFRSERPGEEGLAHLFEHLMFRGSESLPDGGYFARVAAGGGEAGGTTHPDYTDYYQVVPSEAVERALFSEADRMRAPRFTPQALAAQLDGVEAEIRGKTVDEPYGAFPWPLLPSLLYQGFANAHDGYGDPRLLRRLTPDDCAAFFERHYAPSNAVLTVAGHIDPEEAVALIERHFGDIPSRAAAPAPDLREPPLPADVWETRSRPRLPAPAVAVGYRLAGPERGLDDYLAHMVLAASLAGPGMPGLRSSCGFFGPVGARDPDTLVLTAPLREGQAATAAVASVEAELDRLADASRSGPAVPRAARALAQEHLRDHIGPLRRARALGRLELLLGRAELVDELPVRLAGVGPHAVAGAAARLRTATKAVLVLERGAPQRPPPRAGEAADAAAPPRSPSARSSAALGTSADGPRPLPPMVAAPAGSRLRWEETALPHGTRVAAAADPRVPVVELRLRVPLGADVWAVPGAPEHAVGHLTAATDALEQARDAGGVLDIATDGQWLDLSGHAPSELVEAWLSLLAEVLGALPARASPPGPASPPHADPGRAADDALRSHLLAAGRYPQGRQGQAVGQTGPRASALVAVGDLDPSAFVDRAGAALDAAWPEGEHPAPPVSLEAARPARLTVPRVGEPGYIAVSRPEMPAGPAAETARYLATAVFGGYPESRLLARTAGRGRSGYWANCGRDVVGDSPRALVRGSAPRAQLARLAADIEGETERLVEHPPTPAEVERARRYFEAHLRSVRDTPAVLADVLRSLVANGRSGGWLLDVVESGRLGAGVGEVAEAAVLLYGPTAATTVVVGGDETRL